MGKPIEVTCKTDVKDKDGNLVKQLTGACSYDFGDNLAEAIKKFGEPIVYSKFVAQSVIDLQANMRRTLLAGGDLKAMATTWKPGVTATRVVDPIAAAKNKYAQMSPQERADFLASLKAMG
jgi:hypothetical protein